MGDNAVISIITPSFNRADVISETALSIFRQTYVHWEWVIVDDGSTDNSWEILQQFAAQDNRVKVFKRNREPKGACSCRNIAVEHSTGDYLLFLDSDDLLATFCLEQRIKAVKESPECDFVIFPMLLFKKQPDDLKLLWNIDTEKDDLSRILEGEPICQGTGTLWKKAAFQEIGLWREDLKLWQDIELHIRSILWPVKFKKRMDLKPDVFLRISDHSLSRTGYNSLPKLKSRIVVLKYAIERTAERGLLEQYKEGLRHMAMDTVLSTINSSYFTETGPVLEVCKAHDLFTDPEIRNINAYWKVCKYKLYHIQPLKNYYYQKARKFIVQPDLSLGKVQWDGPIVL